MLADGAGSSSVAREAADRTVRSLVNNYETRPRSWTPQKALSEFTRLINHTLHQDSLVRFGEGAELRMHGRVDVTHDDNRARGCKFPRCCLAHPCRRADEQHDLIFELRAITHVPSPASLRNARSLEHHSAVDLDRRPVL